MDGRVIAQYEQNPTSNGDIARGTGISRPHISRIMSGQRSPSLDVGARIASYLGITLDEFYKAHVEARAIFQSKTGSES